MTQSIVVQMDSGTVLNDEDLPPLPDKLEKQLRRRLEQFELYDEGDVREYLENPESTYIFKMQEVEHPEFQGALVRDCFYEFVLTLMKNYRKFWVLTAPLRRSRSTRRARRTARSASPSLSYSTISSACRTSSPTWA